MQQQYWVQEVKPSWLPEGFNVPSEMLNQVQQLCQQAEHAYYQVDIERNGFLRRREFKKAMKRLGINKYEAKHMLIFIDQERLKVVSIKNYVNAYLFIKSGGLNHVNADYQGPMTTVVDQRTHMKHTQEGIPVDLNILKSLRSSTSSHPFASIAQNVFQAYIPRTPIKSQTGWYQSMQAANGMYLCSENGRVVANRTAVGQWERFYFFTDDSWSDYFVNIALRTNWNTYICCDYDNTCNDNRLAVGPWEKFDAEPVNGGNGYLSYKSWSGHYLTADAAGNVSFSATSVGPNEIWYCKTY